ncbi:MAG: hypothetical protein NVSMB33_04470 [Ktedonobacteraceae bacterium]
MADNTNLAEHHVSVTVNAPVHQVYGLFTHFNDFPKFMSFVKEVTYYDDQRSHWVAQAVGQHEWDAVNENWVEDQQIGWRSTSGLENFGKVTFQPMGSNQTRVDVFINYNPPAGVLGDVGEKLGVGARFDSTLQQDMDNFARMVDQAPPGALDPSSSNYLFHSGSAAAKGTTTDRQEQTMNDTTTGSSYSAAPSTSSGYADTTMNDTTTGSSYSSSTTSTTSSSTDYISGTSPSTGSSSGSGYTSGTDFTADNTGYTSNRPVLDQDIISGQYDTEGARTTNPVMPPDTGTVQPVMPPERDPNTNY